MNLRIVFSFSLLFCFQILFSQSNNKAAAEIEILVNKMHQNGQFNGTILVAEKGEIIYKGAFGYGNYEAKRKLVLESPFYLASVSKQFTAMGIMLLKEKGELDYDDPLSKYFPEFPDYAKSVKIEQLMTHTSGVANHYALGMYRPGLTNEDVFQTLIKQEKLDFEPGNEFRYSNGGYVMLAMIIEKVSGQPLPVFMEQNIFAPLQMENTLVYNKDTPEIKNRAIGYTPAWTLEDYEIYTTGAGGLYSTVEDIFKWDQALYTEQLILNRTLKKAFTSAILNDGSKTGYGFGWGIGENINGSKIVNHSGGLNGFRTFIERDLQYERTIIALTNNGSSYLNDLVAAIRDIQNGQKYTIPKINIGEKLHSMLGEHGLEKALERYRKLFSNNTGKYNFDEGELNTLGYYFMGKKEYQTAIAIFQQNVRSYPDRFNTYDSLGEAYMESGDEKNAITNYKKSFELNPGNENAKNMLKKMEVEDSGIAKEKIVVPEKILTSYVGRYMLNKDFIITVAKEGNQLKVQATNQPQFKVFPLSMNEFYLEAVAAQVTFNANKNSEIESLTLFQGGRETVLKRM